MWPQLQSGLVWTFAQIVITISHLSGFLYLLGCLAAFIICSLIEHLHLSEATANKGLLGRNLLWVLEEPIQLFSQNLFLVEVKILFLAIIEEGLDNLKASNEPSYSPIR